MRNVISVLLVVLIAGTGYAGAMGCCNPGTGATTFGSAPHESIRPTECHQIQAIAPVPLVSDSPVPAVEFSFVLTAYRIPLGIGSGAEQAAIDDSGIRRLPERLFLRNRALLI
jgi:hypothetical protein